MSTDVADPTTTVPKPKKKAAPKAAATKASANGAVKSSRGPSKADVTKARFQAIQQAANLLKQVSDPTRLQIIRMIADGEMHVGGICEQLGQSQPAVSHHLALLRHGSIIAPRRQGKNNFYRLAEKGEKLARVIAAVAGE